MKNHLLKRVFGLIAICFIALIINSAQNNIVLGDDIGGFGRTIILRNQARLDFYMDDKGVKLGNNVYLRVLKNRNQLQLWVKQKEKYKFVRNYRICGTSKNLFEGIYQIGFGNLMQNGNNLARIGTDFPNPYNLALKKSGSMFISARCANAPNIGLTDPDTEELYTILYKAFKNGQRIIELHIYPNELNALSPLTAPKGANKNLVSQLSKVFTYFESNRKLPNVIVSKSGYTIVKKKAK